MAQIGATHVKAFAVKNHLGDVAESTYAISLNGTKEVGEQFFAHQGTDLLVVTVTTSSSATAKAIANDVAKSWRW
jgi:uncharacterized membrane protein YgcG